MKFKPLVLSILLCTAIGTAPAQIPVTDVASITQDMMNHLAEMAEMANQLQNAQQQLLQMKQQYEAIYGIKGFADVMKLGGIDPDLIDTFENIVDGDTTSLMNSAKQYLDSLPDCTEAKDEFLCTQTKLAPVAKLDFAERMQDEIQSSMDKITELSQRAQSATDLKSIQELQANIQLQQNRLATLQLQKENFDAVQEAQAKIAAKQAAERVAENSIKAVKATKNASTNTGSYESLLR